MRRLLGWWLVAVGVGCGGGAGQPGRDAGASPDVGSPSDVGRDSGECRVKEDCPVFPCRLAVCLAGVCEYQAVPEGAACSDPERCVVAGVCDAQGTCVGEWACDDQNPCTTDECSGGRCAHTPVETGPCDDGNPCTEGDTCVGGTCASGGKNVCECREDADCPAPKDLCLGRLMCDPQDWACVPDAGAVVTCEAHDNPCRMNRCQPSTGLCVEVFREEGAECDLGRCHEAGTCQAGECVAEPKCVSQGPCLEATCDEATGMCGTKNAQDGTKCDDGNPCTPNDHCVAGKCQGDDPPNEACNGVDDDCDGYTDPENSEGCVPYYWDGDGDGWGDANKHKCLCGTAGEYKAGTPGDCNDGDKTVHPVATETCNGQDDDCDGVTDNPGAEGCVPYYKDGDGDGFGVTEGFQCLCGPSGGYKTTSPGDCDDENAAVHPQASETCDGTDENCDGTTDEGEGNAGCMSWFLDQDGDGYGSKNGKCLCAASGQYTASNNLDCDDGKTTVHPDATEACNGVDDNCDGTTDQGENLSGCKQYYMDTDGDGYGAGTPKCLCQASGQYVTTQAGDCAPGDSTVHPGAKVCGKDGDCDGEPTDTGEACDDANATTWDGCDSECQVGEFQVNSYEVNNQTHPDVAFPGTVANAGFFVAWDGVECTEWIFFPPPAKCVATEEGVWLRRFDGSGSANAVQLVNTYLPGSQSMPAVTASANGAVVVWAGQGSDSETSEVYARRFNSDGTPKDSTATRVNQATTGLQTMPNVVADSSLSFRVVFESRTSDGNSEKIVLRAFTSALVGWDEFQVNTFAGTSGTYLRHPRIAAFDAGTKFVVVWHRASTSVKEDVYFRRFQWNTTALDNTETLAAWGVDSQRDPAVAGNPAAGGGYVVVWVGPGTSGDDIFARVYDRNGLPVVSQPVQANSASGGNQRHPDVAMASDGSFVVVWDDGYDVWFRRFRSDQVPIDGVDMRANRYASSYQLLPALVGASDRTVLMAWQSDSQDLSEYGIFAQRFGPNGERLFR